MDMRTLKYMLSVEETGSITAAAREHFVTQPAVSIQLKKLEAELAAEKKADADKGGDDG